jgi:hypothetical protein
MFSRPSNTFLRHARHLVKLAARRRLTNRELAVHNLFVAGMMVWLHCGGSAMLGQSRQAATKQLGSSHQIAGAAWVKISDAVV